MKKVLYCFVVIVFFTGTTTSGFELKGDVKSWTKDDFIGFDPVGDCKGKTGDISSVFARIEKNRFFLRITFDDMVLMSRNEIVQDNFLNKNIEVFIKLLNKNSKEQVYSGNINISTLHDVTKSFEYLRTPKNNLLEITFGWNRLLAQREGLIIELQIKLDGKIIDEFVADGKGSKDTGNCAFVHHGNQGLTYTDVFYGNEWGISGLDGSGYDEVLQAHEATNLPGNFHMSGTLMPAAEWHNPEFNDWLETMASAGLVSMMTSALGQHIMPFITNEMNNWSVYVESQMVDFRYNYVPRVAWVPERVWLAQGYYPDAGVIDWLGDNWEQHGVWGVVLDDGPHLNGYDNRKIHWMNNGSGVSLRVIPINNTFVGNMHYDAAAAKNQIASMGQYNICVYGTDWEVAAEMNEHDGTFFLDNYEDVLWYCDDNYPGVNVWKLEDAIMNPDFNGTSANLTKGTYGLLGGTGGYGGSNNSWYINWASTPSHSDFHTPQWDYGTVWTDAFNFLTSVNDNSLAQLGWYTLMINLHETGWHTDGQVADWEHRYSSHIKNANVYTEASRWADGQYIVTTACYFDDIDHDGTDELVMHNDKVFMVFEGIGGKANWVFYKNGFGNAYSVVSSDVAYWSETDGDYNESSNNHFAALSDVSPNQQSAVYNININQSSGDTVQATLDQWGVQKTFTLYTGVDYLDVVYDFYEQTGYVKSGWTPDLLDIIWSGKEHLQRVWGDYGSYCGYRNSASGATAALVLGNGGASNNSEFEGTLVKGDEIYGYNKFKMRLYAGYTSPPSGSTVPELDNLASQNMDVFPPVLYSPAVLTSGNEVLLTFSESIDLSTAENISNYNLQNFINIYTLVSAVRQGDWRKVKLTIAETFQAGDAGQIVVSNVEDLNGNIIGSQNVADLTVPTGITPHTIVIDGFNEFIVESELIETQAHSLYISWDNDNLYIGFHFLIFDTEGDMLINIDTDQTPGSGASLGSWTQVDFIDPYLPEYQVAIDHADYSTFNNWDGVGWNINFDIVSFYIGWSGNDGYTEMRIPWSDLGNPSGIAISAHISEEESDIVTEAFPSLNSIGDHPTIEYFYAFFEPYISGPMPLSGMEPNTVYVVPNTAPEITYYDPIELSLSMETNTTQPFSVVVDDNENDYIFYNWKLDGGSVSTIDQYLYEPDAGDVGNHVLEIIVTDNVPGNDPDTVIWNIEVIEVGIQVSLTVFLEGPFNGSQMATTLNAENLIPLVQPYSGSPWNYSGTETVISIPGINVVDWILVELRDAQDSASATSETMIAQQAAFLEKDGTVISINGSNILQFNNSLIQQLFVVIWHRDHLGILSANPLVESGGVYDYDFTTSESQVYQGSDGYKEIAPGVWGMVAGDANADGIIDDFDKSDHWDLQAGEYGYKSADYSLDSQVNNLDKNEIWLPNSGMGSQVSGMVNLKYKCQVP
ncbi:MAG: hypothetical protein H8D45_30150 [Bacteroidetes bacterium]|nr:hypothetical protein [Bacteroidota bacterium]MBL7103974.1 hypothetical protein [Bacteroidales bacterium]